MTPEQLETVAKLAESFDRRISDIDARFVAVEAHLADGARAADEHSKSLQKLQELYLSIDNRLEQLNAMMGNYVEETRVLRRTSQQLISEVREKLKAAGE